MLANVTLRCRMYPAGKVDISQHLAIPGFPRVTILLTSPVRMLVHCVLKHSRPQLLTSTHPQISDYHLLGLQGLQQTPAIKCCINVSFIIQELGENLRVLSKI